MCDLGGFDHRLQNAGFVVRQHQRYHLRVVSSGQCGIQRRQIDHTLLVDEDKSGARTGIEYSRMLNSADESSRRVAQSHYLVVGLGTAAGEHHLVGRCPHQHRDLRARFFHRLTRVAPGAVNRRRVPNRRHCACKRIDDLGPDFRRRVVIQINALIHKRLNCRLAYHRERLPQHVRNA